MTEKTNFPVLELKGITKQIKHKTLVNNLNCYDWTVDLFKSIKSECLVRGFSPELNNTIHVKDTATMCIDFYQLERAIQNILSNCYRYTKNLLSISAEVNNQSFCLRVENDGVVLDASKTEKIFERFYTEESLDAQGHLGLGLYIAKTIIKSMKGDIKANVFADKITFEITLPVL